MMKKVLKKRGRKKKLYSVRIRLNGTVFGRCKYIPKKRRRRSRNGRVHRPAHESDVCPRCLKIFNVRGLGPHLAHCKVVRPGMNINVPVKNTVVQKKENVKTVKTVKPVKKTVSKKKTNAGTSIKVLVLFERGWWHATVSREGVLFAATGNVVSCYGSHLTVRYTMDGSVEDILREDISTRVRSSEDNLDVTVLYDRRWYKAKIPRCNVCIQNGNSMVTCKAGYDDVAVCYDVDSSVERVPRDEVTDRIRLVEENNVDDDDIQKEATESIIKRILSADQVDVTTLFDDENDGGDDTRDEIRIESATERSKQRFKSGKYVRYHSVRGKSSLSFPLGRIPSVFRHHPVPTSQKASQDNTIVMRLSVRVNDSDRFGFLLNVTSAMLHDFSVSQIVSRIFQVHGNHFPKEMSSDRCTLCFARQVWNRNDLLRNVVPSNLGSCSGLTVTLKETSSTTKSKDEDKNFIANDATWNSYLRDRGLVF